MKVIMPFTVLCIVLMVGLVGFYFVSPAGQVSALTAENNLLKSQMAALQGNNESDLVAIVIIGMLCLTALLLTGFFLLLCLLANVRPADFFLPSVRRLNGPAAEHKLITKTTSGNPAEIYPVGERYTMEWGIPVK
ncbi:MAG: hypothetical protein V2I97_24105 [Desulfococcaceae bacterium]|jgi:hypothetical protein|nr:hypothetical protein [Desulfococcaceae bacterium]